jgi:hypothetical protein
VRSQAVRLAEQTDRAGIRRCQHQDRLEQAGLAGAVQPEQTEDLAPAHRQRDVLEDGRGAAAQAQALDLDRPRGGLDHGSRGQTGGAHPRAGPAPGPRRERRARAVMEIDARHAPSKRRPRSAAVRDCIIRHLTKG